MLITVVQKQWYPLLTPHLSSSWACRFLIFCFARLYPVFSMTTTSQLTFWPFSGHRVRESSCSRTQHSNQRSNFSKLCPWQSENHIFYVLTQNTCLHFHLEWNTQKKVSGKQYVVCPLTFSSQSHSSPLHLTWRKPCIPWMIPGFIDGLRPIYLKKNAILVQKDGSVGKSSCCENMKT